MAHFELLEIDEVRVPPRAGWTLAKLYVEYVWEKYKVPGDPEQFDARRISFKVYAEGHSYYDIADFLARMDSLKDTGQVGDIQLIYELPELQNEEALHHDLARCLRSLSPEHKWTDQNGSLLVSDGIVDLIVQLHSRYLRSKQVES